MKMDTKTYYNLYSRANFRRLIGDGAGAMETKALVEMAPKSKETRLARARLSGNWGRITAPFSIVRPYWRGQDDPDALEERALAYIRMGSAAKRWRPGKRRSSGPAPVTAKRWRFTAGSARNISGTPWPCRGTLSSPRAVRRQLLAPRRVREISRRPVRYRDLRGAG